MLRSNLKAIIDEREISIRELSRMTDIHFETVRRFYNDEMNRFPREFLSRMWRVLNVSVSDLLVFDDQDNRSS